LQILIKMSELIKINAQLIYFILSFFPSNCDKSSYKIELIYTLFFKNETLIFDSLKIAAKNVIQL